MYDFNFIQSHYHMWAPAENNSEYKYSHHIKGRYTKVLLRTLFILLVSVFLLNPTTQAEQSVGIDYLHGSDQITGIRLTYRPVTDTVVVLPVIGMVNLYWEGSVNFWEYGDKNTHQTNFALSFSPVIVRRLSDKGAKYPVFFEAGIGASIVNDREFAGKDIGSHYQFEDRLGLIIGLDKERSQELSIRYMHYSNGGLGSKNPGLDFLAVSYNYHF